MKRLFFVLLSAIGLLLSPWNERAQAGETLDEILAGLPVIRGAPVSGDALAGRVVLVAFFASWCPPCKHEFPHLNTIQNDYADDGFQVVAVNVFETFDGLSTPAKLEKFLDETAPSFSILKGNAETRRVFGNLDRIPTMFLFDREGSLDFVFRHERDAEQTHLSEAELRAVIDPLLAPTG
ncbi:MAG: TlpA disulfide reductase family protein [Geminicoccaceae bacterium]